MIKPLHRFIPILALSAVLLGGCVDHDYDLDGLDTDNITVGGELVIPLGRVGIDIADQLPSIPGGSLTIPVPPSITTPSLSIETPFDTDIFDKLDDKTPITIHAEVSSCLSIDMLFSMTFIAGDQEVSLFDNQPIAGSSRGTTSLTGSMSMEDFHTVATASDLTVTLATPSGRTEEGTVTSDATLNITLSVEKSGGIKL